MRRKGSSTHPNPQRPVLLVKRSPCRPPIPVHVVRLIHCVRRTVQSFQRNAVHLELLDNLTKLLVAPTGPDASCLPAICPCFHQNLQGGGRAPRENKYEADNRKQRRQSYTFVVFFRACLLFRNLHFFLTRNLV